MIAKYLEDLEQRISPETEDALYAEWQTFTDGDFTGDIFSPRRMEKIPSSIDKDIKLIGFQRSAAESALKDGRNLHGNVHCAT